MSSKTFYYCDNEKCNYQSDKDDLIDITIEITGSPSNYFFEKRKSSGWQRLSLCPKCAEKLGIVKKIIKEEKIINEVIPTNEQLYNIISQIVWENIEHN